MRKFEMNVPVKALPDIATAIHAEEFVFITKPTDDEELVTIEIPYDKEKDDEISTIEENLNQIVEDFYEKEDNG